jgi:hypothetical protein
MKNKIDKLIEPIIHRAKVVSACISATGTADVQCHATGVIKDLEKLSEQIVNLMIDNVNLSISSHFKQESNHNEQ